MSGFETRFERLELKFLIDELKAEALRSQIEPYCEADAHSLPRPESGANTRGYKISSLYLDTPGLAFHRAKERGDARRIKLRARTYSATSAVTLEIKRRVSDVISKTRAVIDRNHVEATCHGLHEQHAADPQARAFLDEFARIVATSGASPTLTVRYLREAYSSCVDQYARITMDRNIEVRRTSEWNLIPDELDWCRFDHYWKTHHVTTPVVLEIKCQSIVPFWVMDLIRRNDLSRTAFSKYSIGINLTGQVMGHQEHYSRSLKVLR